MSRKPECWHCGKRVRGIRDHIRDVHGYPYYTMTPDFRYGGKYDPPCQQTHDFPDESRENQADD